jgi:hypothetical protein
MQIDPYELLAKTFGGSGYDIACATAKSAITYQKISNLKSQISNPIDSDPSFAEQSLLSFISTKNKTRAKAFNIIKT